MTLNSVTHHFWNAQTPTDPSGNIKWAFSFPSLTEAEVAPTDGEVAINIGEGFFAYPVFKVYTGNALTNLTAVTVTGSPFSGITEFQAISNTTYYLAWVVSNGENPAIPFTLEPSAE